MSVKIIKGEDRLMTVFIKTSDKAAYDLSTVEQITATFCDVVNNTTFDVTLYTPASVIAGVPVLTNPEEIRVIGNAECGKITVKLTDTQTNLLDEGTQGFTITIQESGGDLRKINLANSIIVEAPIC